MVNALANEGPLAAGTMPTLEMGTKEGMKKLCESVAAGAVNKTKKPKLHTTPEAEEVEPATVKENFGLVQKALLR